MPTALSADWRSSLTKEEEANLDSLRFVASPSSVEEGWWGFANQGGCFDSCYDVSCV